MIATHQPERQLSLLFTDESQLPEAALNECGVMVANTLQRTYTGTRSTMGFKDSVQIVVGHYRGGWAAGRSLRIDTEYTGSAPSFKWGEYDSMSDAIENCIDWAVIALRRKIASEFADARAKAGAQELLELIERGAYEEVINASQNDH